MGRWLEKCWMIKKNLDIKGKDFFGVLKSLKGIRKRERGFWVWEVIYLQLLLETVGVS